MKKISPEFYNSMNNLSRTLLNASPCAKATFENISQDMHGEFRRSLRLAIRSHLHRDQYVRT